MVSKSAAKASNIEVETQHRSTVLAILVLGAFVSILNQTLLNVAIPKLMNAFDVSADTIQWLSTGYMLTNGVLIPITAFLIGTFTTRQLFIFAMGSFTAGSFICSISPGFTIMMIGRVVQGIGAGIIMPLMMTVILNLYPPEKRGTAMGTIAIAMFFAPAVGPTLSGWMLVHWTWRLLFYVVIPIAIIDIILAASMLKNVTDQTYPKFDTWGFFTSLVGFSTLLYGFSEAGNKGWSDGIVITTISIGVIFLMLFVIQEVTSKDPMLDLSVFRYWIFSLGTIISCVLNMALFGAMLLVPIYLQNIRGFTPLQSGLVLLPGAIIMGIMAPISGALMDKYGARPLAIIGLIITALTTWQFSHLTGQTTLGHVVLLYTERMFGMSFIAMTIMTASLNALPRRLNSHGTAASNTAKQVAASLGTALMVTIMSDRAKYHFADYANSMTSNNLYLTNLVNQLSQELAAQLNQPIQAGQEVVGQMLYGMTMQQSTIDGINDSFIVATLITIVALFLSFFLSRPKNITTKEASKDAVLGLPEPRKGFPVTMK